MDKELKKFKKKIYMEIVVKCSLYSLSIALFGVAVLFILSKNAIIKLTVLGIVLIGVILLGVAFGFLFYLMKPNEMSMAKRIDQEFNLDEKVSTMVYLKKSNDPMAIVQRENTCQTLSKISPKKFSLKIALIGLLAVTLSGGTLAYSLATPKRRQDDIGNIDTPIDEIINRIEFSNINEIIKEKLLTILNNVLNYLNNTSYTTEQKIAYLDKAISDVYYIELNDLTHYNIGLELMKLGKTHDLGSAINDNDGNAVKRALDALNAEFQYLKDTGLDNGLKEFAKQVREALEKSKAPEDDELYVALEKLAKTLDSLAKKVNKDKIYENITAAIEQAKIDILTALKNQQSAEELCDEVIKLLEDLKKMLEDPSQNPNNSTSNNSSSDNQDQTSQKPDDEDNNSSNSGQGNDDSELIYAGNDVVYNPDSNTNVEYGEVIDDYYKDLINDLNNGNIDKTLEDMMNDYFTSLYYDGKTNTEESNNG